MVGPNGVVVGLDISSVALEAARTGLATLGLDSVHLVEADINSIGPTSLAPWAPFDLAVCRLLLVHQRDPVATLRYGGAILGADLQGELMTRRTVLNVQDFASGWVCPA
jgi:hypothetical protein